MNLMWLVRNCSSFRSLAFLAFSLGLLFPGSALAIKRAEGNCPSGYKPVETRTLLNYGRNLDLTDNVTRVDRFQFFSLNHIQRGMTSSSARWTTGRSRGASIFSVATLTQNPSLGNGEEEEDGARKFASPAREQATRRLTRLYRQVAPDGYGAVQVYANNALSRTHRVTAAYAPAFYDAKVTNSNINPGSSSHQATGFIDVLERSTARSDLRTFPILAYLTISDTGMGSNLRSSVSLNRVTLWQSFLCELDGIDRPIDSVARFTMSQPVIINPDLVLEQGFSVGRLSVPRPGTFRLFRTDDINGEPPPGGS